MARQTHTDAALTISAAARVCGCDRRTLQRAVQAGRLTLDAQHCLSREALVAAGYLDAPMPHDTPQMTPQVTPQETPQELPLVTALLAHLEQLTRTIVALHQEVILLREDLRQTPQRRRSPTPQSTPRTTPHDAAPVPHHDALTPQARTATPVGAETLPPYLLTIAEVAAEYDKLSLTELAQLLYDRGVYRTRDRQTKAEKPVNKGTLARWLAQTRQAGML